MVRQHALMESLSANLHGFLHQIDGNMSRPNQKFLQDARIGLLRAGRPIVCQMARQLPNQRTEYTTRVKRLDEHLVTPGDFDQRIKEALPELWLPLIQDDTPIILDLSDIAKPLAKKMDYLATVRDPPRRTGCWSSTGAGMPLPCSPTGWTIRFVLLCAFGETAIYWGFIIIWGERYTPSRCTGRDSGFPSKPENWPSERQRRIAGRGWSSGGAR